MASDTHPEARPVIGSKLIPYDSDQLGKEIHDRSGAHKTESFKFHCFRDDTTMMPRTRSNSQPTEVPG
eukprot:751578-Hanusia_phi.AAC.2